MYVVDGLFDTTNTEFEGRASVGLDLGRPCVLEDGINHGMFVAGLVGGRRTGVAKKAKIVAVGSSYGCEGSESASQRADDRARGPGGRTGWPRTPAGPPWSTSR